MKAWRRIEALARRRPLVLAMDFDGTLAPIVKRPALARMPPRVRRILKGLLSKDLTLALLSGRSLPDLRRRTGMKGLSLCGAHGLSSNVRGLGLSPAQARLWRAQLRKARRTLAPLGLAGLGVKIEDKGLGLALHLRGAKAGVKRGLSAKVEAALGKLPLDLRPGLEILEIRPRAGWDKGRALLKLADILAPGWRKDGACLFAGDDATDEDAFRDLRRHPGRGLGLKIGRGKSLARLRLKSPAQFWGLLKKISSLNPE